MLNLFFQIGQYPFPPLFRMTEDFCNLARAGASGVQIRLPWCRIESVPGRYDFSFLTPYLKSLKDNGLSMVFSPLGEAPFWVDAQTFPDAFTHFIEALQSEFSGAKSPIAWNLNDLQSINPVVSRDTFEAFLRKTYGDIHTLNRAWNRSYFSFDLIPMETPLCYSDRAESLAKECAAKDLLHHELEKTGRILQKTSKKTVLLNQPAKTIELLELPSVCMDAFLRQEKFLILSKWDPDSPEFNFGSVDSMLEERIRFIRETKQQADQYAERMSSFEMDRPSIALFRDSESFADSVKGWIQGLTACGYPFARLDSGTPDLSDDWKLIVIPARSNISEASAKSLLDFVQNGGILFCECETGCFSGTGAPIRPDARWIAEAVGIAENATPQPLPIRSSKRKLMGKMTPVHYRSPFHPLPVLKNYTTVILPYGDQEAAMLKVPYGEGVLILSAWPYGAEWDAEFLSEMIVSLAGIPPAMQKDNWTPQKNLRMISGRSGKGKTCVFVCPPGSVKADYAFAPGCWKIPALYDLMSTKRIPLSGQKIKWKPSPTGVTILTEKK